jgi:hypothetical protein
MRKELKMVSAELKAAFAARRATMAVRIYGLASILASARDDVKRGRIASPRKPAAIGHGDVIRFRRNGEKVTAVVAIVPDSDHGAPWEEECGHGTVSDWTRRAKAPGEIVLYQDRDSKRFYDFAEAVRTAKRDGWGFMPHEMRIEPVSGRFPDYAKRGGTVTAGPFKAHDATDFNRAIAAVYAAHKASFPSAKAYAAAAAMADFERLRQWCNDQWSYVGVCLFELPRDGVQRDPEHIADSAPFGILNHAALWGIESDSPDYHADVAHELTSEL